MKSARILQCIVLFVTVYGSIGRNSDGFRRMINGKKATAQDWPFIVNLNFPPDAPYRICTGALIKRNWAITAAHCIKNIRPETLKIGVGRMDRPETSSHIFMVQKIVMHEDYLETLKRINRTYIWDDDIALIKLTQKVPTTIQLLKLPDKSVASASDISRIKGVQCKAAGWGKTTAFSSTDDIGDLIKKKAYKISSDLLEIDIPLLTRKECIAIEKGMKESNYIFCGGGPTKGAKVSGCIGDSGSPLTCSYGKDSKKKKILAGIMLGGPPTCSAEESFIKFTDVAKYSKWIEKKIQGTD